MNAPIVFFKNDPEVRKQILLKYNRSDDEFLEDVERMRKWVEKQSHFPEIPSDKIMETFLILNKCRLEKAKEKLDKYYTIRSALPEFFDNNNPGLPHMKNLVDKIYWIPLPQLTQDHYRMFIFKLRDVNFKDFNPYHFFSLTYSQADIRMLEDYSLGDVLIYDMEGLTLSHLSKLTPAVISKTIMIYEKVYSSPLKAIHFINSPTWINTIMSAIKAVMKPKLALRIHAHQKPQDLHQFFSLESLPKDYGGSEKSLEQLNDAMKLKYREYQDRFDQVDRMRVKEELRPENLKNDDLLGFHGNFNKLNID